MHERTCWCVKWCGLWDRLRKWIHSFSDLPGHGVIKSQLWLNCTLPHYEKEIDKKLRIFFEDEGAKNGLITRWLCVLIYDEASSNQGFVFLYKTPDRKLIASNYRYGDEKSLRVSANFSDIDDFCSMPEMLHNSSKSSGYYGAIHGILAKTGQQFVLNDVHIALIPGSGGLIQVTWTMSGSFSELRINYWQEKEPTCDALRCNPEFSLEWC